MADEDSDKESKTEQPTEHKIQKAVKKGNLPVSREMSLFAGILAFTVIAFFVVYPAFENFIQILTRIFERPDDFTLTSSEDLDKLFFVLFTIIGKALLPIFVIILVLGIASFAVQNMPRFVMERIRPQFSRISLTKGFQRLFSKSNFIEFIKSLSKFLITSLIVYLVFFQGSHIFSESFLLSPSLLPDFIRTELGKLLVSNCIAMLILAGFDLTWSRIKWKSNLRMSRYELKQEYKEMEGDPIIRARMKSLARDRIRRQMILEVPKATLIIANPTHFSVALRYNPPEDIAPVLIAKGQDILALKIREVATENDIPVIENVALARALYKQVEINQLIPEDFYQAVAELIRYINER